MVLNRKFFRKGSNLGSKVTIISCAPERGKSDFSRLYRFFFAIAEEKKKAQRRAKELNRKLIMLKRKSDNLLPSQVKEIEALESERIDLDGQIKGHEGAIKKIAFQLKQASSSNRDKKR